GVMLACENIASAAHVGCKLIDFIKSTVHDSATKSLVPQVAYDEIVGVGFREFMKFQIDPANPKVVLLEPFNKMAANESTGSADQGTFRHFLVLAIKKQVHTVKIKTTLPD